MLKLCILSCLIGVLFALDASQDSPKVEEIIEDFYYSRHVKTYSPHRGSRTTLAPSTIKTRALKLVEKSSKTENIQGSKIWYQNQLNRLNYQTIYGFKGHFTYYNDKGYGACGDKIDAESEMLVAVSHKYFTKPNPNEDPICQKCVKVDYKGKSITVPVKDECPSCEKDHMDLSYEAFTQLADPDVGDVYGGVFQFVDC